MAKDNFQEKRNARIERYKRLSETNEAKSESSFERSRELGSHIPMGQPILVGHHSERGHRAQLKRIDNAMRKSIEEGDKAKYYERKAKAAASNRAIFSDDPEAITKLKKKIASLERNQEEMKSANKIIKSKKLLESEKIDRLKEMRFTESQAISIMEPDYAGRIGFAPYSLSNNNSNIRTAKKRLERLRKDLTRETTETMDGDIRVVENAEANRIQLIFDGKPSDVIRSILRHNGFRWSPRFTAWQRHLNNFGIYAKDRVLNKINETI